MQEIYHFIGCQQQTPKRLCPDCCSTWRSEHSSPEQAVSRAHAFMHHKNESLIDVMDAARSRKRSLYEAVKAISGPYAALAANAHSLRLPQETKHLLQLYLYPVRTKLERVVAEYIDHLLDSRDVYVSELYTGQVFGDSKKQGVSFRLGLITCTPTPSCSIHCYAHDGRERGPRAILRGVINTVLARRWKTDRGLDVFFTMAVQEAVRRARAEAEHAAKTYGFKRRPRIRFSHTGDVLAFPDFAHWLGETVRIVGKNRVDPVIYTRSYAVSHIDPDIFVTNFTLNPDDDIRDLPFDASRVKTVCSAWNGRIRGDVDINFMEHHDGHYRPERNGRGFVCPVTLSSRYVSCDQAKCAKCFTPKASR